MDFDGWWTIFNHSQNRVNEVFNFFKNTSILIFLRDEEGMNNLNIV